MNFEEREKLFKVFKKKYPLLLHIRNIPNVNGLKIYVIDKNEIFWPTEVYMRDGAYHIQFSFEETVGFVFYKDMKEIK